MHLRLNYQAGFCPEVRPEGSLLCCLGHPSPQSLALGTHRLHDPGDSWVFTKLLHKQVILARHLKGFGEEVALGCLQLSCLALQLFPEPLQVLHHVVLAGQLSRGMDGQAFSPTPPPTLPIPTAPTASIVWPTK